MLKKFFEQMNPSSQSEARSENNVTELSEKVQSLMREIFEDEGSAWNKVFYRRVDMRETLDDVSEKDVVDAVKQKTASINYDHFPKSDEVEQWMTSQLTPGEGKKSVTATINFELGREGSEKPTSNPHTAILQAAVNTANTLEFAKMSINGEDIGMEKSGKAMHDHILEYANERGLR